MSAIDTNRVLGRAGHTGTFSKLIDAVVAWNDARVTRNALAKLSDRELSDIGLTRYDAEHMGL